MSFKEVKDERLQLQKYKAGYQTYNILMIIHLMIAIALVYAIDITTNPIVLIAYIPFFAGLWIYEFKAEEAEEFDEEQTVLNAASQRRTWIIIAKRAVFVALFGSLTNYFLMSEQDSLLNSIQFGLLNGVCVGIFWYYHTNKILRKNTEQENDKTG
ncbi:MAG TPA: hypothetical protein VEC36_12535 [Patescibacteria group bacterium]|nr:hypothetical protein [Patescibacteria group bacterium]